MPYLTSGDELFWACGTVERFRLRSVAQVDELLLPVALGVASDDRPVQGVQGGELGSGSISLVGSSVRF